jgi:hypothetical protein
MTQTSSRESNAVALTLRAATATAKLKLFISKLLSRFAQGFDSWSTRMNREINT